jgi:hypothetical protein
MTNEEIAIKLVQLESKVDLLIELFKSAPYASSGDNEIDNSSINDYQPIHQFRLPSMRRAEFSRKLRDRVVAEALPILEKSHE